MSLEEKFSIQDDTDLTEIEKLTDSLYTLSHSVDALKLAIHKLNTRKQIAETHIADNSFDDEEMLHLLPKPTLH